MCGIGGIVKLSTGARSPLPAELAFMTDVLRHRGPDGHGQWIDPNGIVGLCHRRLAIVDLSEHGAQPMVGAAGPVITYNGEVYNHVELRNQLVHKWPFASRSDTEVILAAYQRWGTGCVDHLRGMYAFAIWDPARKVLFAARDNLGIKPFYYAIVDDRLIFASEIKAILPFLPETKVCKDGLAEYLTYQFNVGAQTMFEGVYALPPGHVLTVDEGRIKTYAHWDVQYRIDTDHSKSYFYTKLQDIVDRSVRIHLRSDVPVGCYLSGGVDSSLISLLSTQHDSSNKHSFHGKFTQFPGYDESAYAQTVAEQSSKSLHQLDITEDDVLGSIEDITYYLDQPTAGPGSIPQYLVSKLAAQHVKVVLGGQGGDEIFAGYARYLVAYFEQTLRAAIDGTNRQGTFVVTAESIIPNLASLKEYKPMLASFWQSGLFEAPDSRYFRLIDRFSDMSGEILPEHVNREAIFERFQAIFNNHSNVQSRSYLDRMTHFDLKTLLPALLHVEDRMSMAHGIESRVPFVDHELVSFMATVPANIKFRDGGLKVMLKEAYAGLLPPSILERKDKMGFPVPLAEWYNGKLGTFVRDTFSSRAARERSLYDTKRIVAALGQNGKFSRKTWGLLSLELWHQRFIDRAAEMRATLANALDGQVTQPVVASADFRGRRKAG
ncbi:asparagine synthase (glutamine-hydrolyzing) [Boseaceae bacterium BT-24-1]|nr:asparagine synthase (glutamine-hydrolyzing) [Boseaceae bacterium BT-24-1]